MGVKMALFDITMIREDMPVIIKPLASVAVGDCIHHIPMYIVDIGEEIADFSKHPLLLNSYLFIDAFADDVDRKKKVLICGRRNIPLSKKEAQQVITVHEVEDECLFKNFDEMIRKTNKWFFTLSGLESICFLIDTKTGQIITERIAPRYL